MADRDFDAAYRELMGAFRSDASRRRSTARGHVPYEPAPGQEAGVLEAMGVVGAPVAMAGRALAAAPRAIGAVAGGMLGMSAANESEAQSRKGGPLPVDPADEAAAARLPEHLRPQYLDLAARNRARQLNRSEREQFTSMNRILSESALAEDNAGRARAAADENAARTQRAAELTRAEEARQAVMRDAPKAFSDQFPTWNSLQGFLPLAVGAATTLPYAVRGGVGAARAAKDWRTAAQRGLDATDGPTLAAQNRLAQAYSQQFPPQSISTTLQPYAVPATIGAIEGAGVANLPEAYNAFLPATNPEVRAYQEYLKQLPPGHPGRAAAEKAMAELPGTMPARDAAFDHFGSTNFLKRMGVGALEGAAGAVFGSTLAKPLYPSEKSLPRAQTNALLGRVSGEGLDDASRAIAAETRSIGTVLPLPPARQQLAPPPAAAAQAVVGPSQPVQMMTPVQTPAYQPSGAPVAPQRQAITSFQPGSSSAAAIGMGALVADPFMQELIALRQMLVGDAEQTGAPGNNLLAHYYGR